MICVRLLLTSNLFPQIRFRPEQHFGIRVGWVEVRERAPSHSQLSLSLPFLAVAEQEQGSISLEYIAPLRSWGEREGRGGILPNLKFEGSIV